QPLVPLCPFGATCHAIIGGTDYTVQGACPDMSSVQAMQTNHCQFGPTPQVCAAGAMCIVTLGDTEYLVHGACTDMSSTSAMDSNHCQYGVFQVCDIYGCGNNLVDPHLTLYYDAVAKISSLRGISNDNLNAFWSGGEITAYMYLRLLALAQASPDDG